LVSQSVYLANDPALRAKLGDAGRRFVTEERSWEKLGLRYVRMYEEVLRASIITREVITECGRSSKAERKCS